eukprot:CAMPEP_0119043022 /NCGR_PEP_ID=MMETSP1177-20130426/16353_1 /TAXON_ID=2985 /ORGANISM="Ochromonas sp, Strain CCMP1899" /LENGTH=300 /DNA_ID=CAMNT_0007010187 /DNA_START=188 /DNA_END=1087 /DNA_ORIENTATION=-
MEVEGTGGASFSTLQHLLQLSYSENPEDQQKAAVDLARLVESTVIFPAVSFGPLAHALCRLIPNKNRTVASYSAKALKLLILDDALRPQAVVAGVPAVVCAAIKQWEDELLCLRELLGALQTLCWDKQCVKGVLQADIVSHLIDYIQASDQEVAVLALATLSNILAFVDTLLLADTIVIEALGVGIPPLLEILRTSQQRPQRFYAAASIANASAHPRLAGILKQNGGLQLCRDVERQSLANLHILGSRMGDCAQTAVYRLSDQKDGNTKLGLAKFSFKWGNKPVMELSLASYSKYGSAMW